MWWIAISTVVLVAIILYMSLHPSYPHVVVACDRGNATCLVTTDGSEEKLPIASITTAHVVGNDLVLERSTQGRYLLCTAPPAELADTATQLQQFFRSPTTSSIKATCDSTLINTSPKPIVALVAPLGALTLLSILGYAYGIKAHTIIDRDTHRITLRGWRWPLKRWNLTRPISEAEVVMKQFYMGRPGSYSPYVYIKFDNISLYNVMGPCSRSGVDDKVATIRKYLTEA